MKKLFLSVAIALGVFAANAQDNMWVGGTVGLWGKKIEDAETALNFRVAPEFGYILNENFGIGIALGGSHIHSEVIGYDTHDDNYLWVESSSTNSYFVNPFVRYTFLKSTLGGLFVDGGLSYGWSKGTSGGAKGTDIEVGLKPGLAINVSNKVALIGKFGFLGYQQNKQGDIKTDVFGFDFDMNNIELGASIKF